MGGGHDHLPGSGDWKLSFSPEMVRYLKEHQQDFMPEDTKAGHDPGVTLTATPAAYRVFQAAFPGSPEPRL